MNVEQDFIGERQDLSKLRTHTTQLKSTVIIGAISDVLFTNWIPIENSEVTVTYGVGKQRLVERKCPSHLVVQMMGSLVKHVHVLPLDI